MNSHIWPEHTKEKNPPQNIRADLKQTLLISHAHKPTPVQPKKVYAIKISNAAIMDGTHALCFDGCHTQKPTRWAPKKNRQKKPTQLTAATLRS